MPGKQQQQTAHKSPAHGPAAAKAPAPSAAHGKQPAATGPKHKKEEEQVAQKIEELHLDEKHSSIHNQAGNVVGTVKPCKVELLKSATHMCDVVLLLDITEGMDDPIKACGECIDDLVKEIDLAKEVKTDHWDYRIAVVGYRDIMDGKQELLIGQFIPHDKLDVLHSDLKALEAKGGGADVCEDVISALDAVNNMPWRGDDSCRVVFHIADAPCHGSMFHEASVQDSNTHGIALEPSVVVGNLARKKIDYYFLKINNSTDTMIKKFNQFYQAARPGSAIKTLQLQGTYMQPADLAKAISDSVVASIKNAVRYGGKK